MPILKQQDDGWWSASSLVAMKLAEAVGRSLSWIAESVWWKAPAHCPLNLTALANGNDYLWIRQGVTANGKIDYAEYHDIISITLLCFAFGKAKLSA